MLLGSTATQKYTHSIFLPLQAQREMDCSLIALVQLVRLVMITLVNTSHSWLFCHVQVVLSYIKSRHKELSKAILCLSQNLGGICMKNKELLALCCAIRGESGVKGFSEGQGVVWQHTARVICQQKQSVAQTWHRHAPGMGTKWRTGTIAGSQNNPCSRKRGKITFIKYLYRFALWECETKGNALMLSFQDH